MTQSYPLHWPLGMLRTKFPDHSRFRVSYADAQGNVLQSLKAFAKEGGKDIVNLIISSNITMMIDEPKDGGVAVYFRWNNIDCCIAVDKYRVPRENLQAIHHVIEAERTKLRHGGLHIVTAAFRGYAALPPPKGPDGQLAKPWWAELGFQDTPPLAEAEAKYREMVKTHHPDRGGDPAAFNVVTDAIKRAREELRP